MENPISLLVEFCQKYKLGFPLYTSEMNEERQWKSHIVCDQFSYSDEKTFSSKSESRKYVAGKILKVLRAKYVPQPQIFNLSGKIGIFVDLENMVKEFIGFIQHIDLRNSSSIHVHVFTTAAHPQSKKMSARFPPHPNLIYHSISSDYRDACDVGIIYEIGKSVTLNVYTNYIIFTRDHFAHSLREIIQSDDCQSQVCSSPERCFDLLDQLQDKTG